MRPLRRRDYSGPSWLQRRPQLVWLLLLAPALAYLGVFFFYPLLRIFLRSLFSPDFTLRHYARVLAHPAYLKILWITVRISLVVAVVSLLVGYPVAFCLSRVRDRVAEVLLALVLVPFWTSVLVRSYAWIVILRTEGLVNGLLQATGLTTGPLPLIYNETGVVVGMVHVLLPYMILSLYGVMREIDPAYLRAAANLGAGLVPTFLRVYLPLSMPGVTSGVLLVFIFSIGFFITPALLGGGKVEMIALQIETQINELVDWGFGSALSVMLFGVVVGLVLLFLRVFDVEAFGGGRSRRLRIAEATAADYALADARAAGAAAPGRGRVGAGPLAVPRRRGRGRFDRPRPAYGWLTLQGATAAVLVFLVAPVLIIIPMSFSTTTYLAFPPKGFTLAWYTHYLTDTAWMAATGLSLRVAGLTTLGSVVLGALGAIGLVRGTFPRKYVAYFAILAPLIIPVIISAVAIYFLFVQLRLVGSLWAFVLAHMVVAIPVVVIVVSAALRRVDESLERAATILGATRVRAFLAVTLPIIRPSILAASLFAFISSFDEIVMALFLAGTTSSTLPKKMWESLRFQIDPTISAVSTLLVVLSLVVLIGATLLQGRSRGPATPSV
ncbi:MAG: ABC transporter permease subunit [Candidatus Rokubacteria bacterium]|nr:ABC transporter permease subunit [Candidatus Rokubacteria bacterium]